MKFYALLLSFCLMQICSGFSSDTVEELKEIRAEMSKINGLSQQFVGDVNMVLDEYKNDTLVQFQLGGAIRELVKMSIVGNGTINMESIKNVSVLLSERRSLDNGKIFQALLLRRLPAERTNNLIYSMYAIRQNAKGSEMQNALNYLYGIGEPNTLPTVNIPDVTAKDCPEFSLVKEIPKLKSMEEIRPKVTEDLAAIFEKFPCQDLVDLYLVEFIDTVKAINTRIHADTSKIDYCNIIKEDFKIPMNDFWMYWLENMVTILSTRLPEDDYSGIFNFLKSRRDNTTDGRSALKYLYGAQMDNVDLTKC